MPSLRTGLTIVACSATVVLGGLVAPAPATAAPQVGACYSYKAAVLTEASTPAPPVDCARPAHRRDVLRRDGARVVRPAVGGLARRKVLSAGRPCTVRAMNAYLGLQDRELPSRFRTVVLFPTDDQWAAGERWVRCDVVLQGGLQLKAYAGTGAALVAAAPAEQFNFCTPQEPNAQATAAYPCLNPKKNWIKVLDQELGGPGSSFPGTSTVERKTRALCEKQGKKWDGKEKYPGWWAIWPTQAGWKEGKRSAQCFVPYKQYLKELASKAPAPTPAPVPDPGADAGPDDRPPAARRLSRGLSPADCAAGRPGTSTPSPPGSHPAGRRWSSLSTIDSDRTIESIVAGRVAPGIGIMTGVVASSQASTVSCALAPISSPTAANSA